MSTLEQRVLEAFAKGTVKDVNDLTLETDFQSIDVDSTDLLCMIFELEEEFDFEIPQDFENKTFETIGDVAKAVREHVEENNIDITPKG
jgi:acyl carrier protein